MITGKNVGLVYGTETVYGTAVATSTAIGGKVTNFAPKLENSTVGLRGLGEGRNVSTFVYGNFVASGTISFQVADFKFLQHLIGTLSGDGLADATAWTLTEKDTFGITAGTHILPFTLRAFKDDGSADVEDTYSGCVLTDATFSGTEDGIVMCDANFIAKSYSGTTTLSGSFSPNTVAPYIAAQSLLKWDATPTTQSKISNWSITINNNAIQYRSIGSRFIEQPVAGFRDYTFTITVRESQTTLTTLMSNFLDDASAAYEPNTGVTSAIPTAGLKLTILMAEGALSGDRKASILLDECVLTDWSETISGEDIVQGIFNGIAKKGVSNAPIKWVD